jgi:hypothetical protein
MQMLAADAIAKIRSGTTQTPEGINALASVAREMANKARLYRTAIGTMDALNIMKELHGSGRISEEDVAKNIGLVTGRFGAKSPTADALRQLVQESLAHEVPTSEPGPYPAAAGGGGMRDLIARALK